MRLLGLLLAAVPARLIAACGGDDGLDDRFNVADPNVRFAHAAQPSRTALEIESQ